MVFIHFPSNNTDEEIMLQNKYAKLKKKKKLLEKMKDPKPEPEKVNPLKRPLDPKDAKELAKKLILSGKVSLPHKGGNATKTVFKRPRTLERKILATGRSEGHGGLTPGYNTNFQNDLQFEPFTPAPHSHLNSSQDLDELPSIPAPPSPTPKRPITKHLSKKESMDNYSNAVDRGPHQPNKSGGGGGHPSKPKRGPTIYVQAHNITEEILRQHFSKFGKIINVKMNNPTVGFITYDKVDGAEMAVQEMNGITMDEISYDVQFARRQPNITQLINDASASASWSAMAASNSQKSNFQDKRQQVVYDEPMEM